MNELALFAGAGGGLLGSKLLKWKTVCAVEFNEHARNVLVARQNDGSLEPFPIWDDVQTFDGKTWRGYIDIISGGFPCQAFSTAAHGNNTAQDYWPEMLRIIGEVCPRYVLAENVSEEAIIRVQADLEESGYWTNRCKLTARFLGADHLRERFWLFADSNHKSELGSKNNAKMAVIKECLPTIWQTKPGNPRMVNGVAHRVERYTRIGNGQIPAMVVTAWNLLKE